MELLLNLLWLAMVLPAFWLWRHERAQAQNSRHLTRLSFALLLGSLLLVLFPAISASDDLHPVCQEAEEATPGKRLARQGATHRFTTLNGVVPSPAALASAAFWFFSSNLQEPLVLAPFSTRTQTCFSAVVSSRAPPSSHIG